MFDAPNLDDISTDSLDYRKLANVLVKMANYCEYKSQAIDYRKEGNIKEAKYLEKLMQIEYNNLPKWAQW